MSIPRVHTYADPRVVAPWVHKTPYGTFRVCQECHDAGHCPTTHPTHEHRDTAEPHGHACQCEHADHFDAEAR